MARTWAQHAAALVHVPPMPSARQSWTREPLQCLSSSLDGFQEWGRHGPQNGNLMGRMMIDIDQPYSQPSALGVTFFLDKTRRTCQIRLAGPRSLVTSCHILSLVGGKMTWKSFLFFAGLISKLTELCELIIDS